MRTRTTKQESPGKNSVRLLAGKSLAFVTLVALMQMAGAVNSRAASDTWDGSVDGIWATSANWLTDPATVPGTGEIATFSGAGNGNTTIGLGAGVTVSNILFDTASAAAYTIGAGAVGSQTLTLDNGGQLSLAATVVNNQLINASLNLSTATNSTTTFANDSSSLLTIAGNISAIPTNGNSLLTISGTGNTVISGVLTETGAGNLALLKTGPGRLTLSTNAVWSGSGALGRIPTNSAGFPLVAREGTLLLSGGTNTVNGELVIGGVVADGGVGQNAKIIVDGSRLDLTSWFSVGRGNGVGGVSSDLVLTNAAVVTAPNVSAGFNGSGAANFPKGSITLNNNSTFTVTGNGAFHLAESPGSDMTLTLNNSAQFIATGTGGKELGQTGKGTVNINDSSSMILGNATTYIGYRTGTGVVNMASSGTFNVGGEFRVGGSDQSGTGRNASGTLNVSSGTVNLGGLVVARGNNNQNGCNGQVLLTGGTVTITNDVVIGFAGLNNLGKVTLSGATVNMGPAATKWLMVGRWDTTSGQLEINSGNLNLMNNTAIKMNADGTIGANVVNQNGGSVTFYSDAGTTVGGTGDLDLQRAGSASSVNTYNLNGGTLTVPRISSTQISGSRTFNFNGGTLKAAASSATFMNLALSGPSRINVRNGGAIIDSNGKDITIVQSLDHSDVGGDAAVDGGLNLSGLGTLTLAGGASYTGPTVVNGGGLSVDVSIGNVTTSGSLTVNGAAFSVKSSGGSYAFPAGSVTLQNSVVLNVDYGTLSANPTQPFINASGSLTTSGSTVTINVSGFGLQAGPVTLIKYTGTPLSSIANFTLGTLPPGVAATLVNNTANNSIDLNITSTGQNLTWYGYVQDLGVVNSNWDITLTTNWVSFGTTTPARYQEYTTTTTVGDPVHFDDTLYVDPNGIIPPATNIYVSTAVRPFAITVDSASYPYAFSGPGDIAGLGSLIKSNSASLTIATSNSFTGGTFVYGGEVVITNENALGAASSKLTLGGGGLQVNANATNTTRAVSVIAASTLGVVAGSTYQVGGVISGSGNLDKIDEGTLVVSGSNGITGSLIVDKGVVRNTGNQTLSAVARVGNTSGSDGVLSIPAGTFRANNNGGQFASSLIIGGVSGAAGDVLLNGGTLNVLQQLGLGAGQGGYASLNMSGGTLSCGSYIVVGFNNDRAVYNQTSGSVTLSSNLMTIAAGDTGAIGVANISGGTFTSSFGLSSGIMVGERGVGTLNISGSAVVNVPTNNGLTVGPGGSFNGWDGTLNLNGGTLTANRVVKGGGTGVAKANFNGGTLKASTANNSFLSGMDSAKVYSGGLTIDDGGFTVGVPQALQAPTDYGVGSISIPLGGGGSGYLDAPIVTISGGSGSNATAVATVAGGVVTAVTVTCPGSGYSSSDALAVSFESGGSAIASTATATATLTPLVSGGITKKGAGTVTLTGTNTYTGTTVVSAGTLMLTPAHQSAGAVTVSSNAAFGVLQNSTGAATVGNVTLGSAAVDRAALAFALSTGSNPTSPILQAGTLTVNGTNSVRLSGVVAAGTFPLMHYSTFAGSGVLSSVASVPQGMTAVVTNDTSVNTIFVTVSGEPGIVWSGTNSVASLTNVWNISSPTNWLAAGLPAAYLEATPPGDPVTFNDIGSGTVLLSNTVSPASVLISNNAVNYTFSGSGKISGTTGLTKQGSGTATLALSGSDYNGNTVVSEGTLKLGSATAIPDGTGKGNVSVGANGSLDVSGFSETINGLSGSGTINNSSATASTLTIGNGNVSSTWAGTTVNGAGTVAFLKTGTGSLTISGTNALGGTSQFNGGTNYLTSTGRIDPVGSGEFWVQQNAGTSTFIVDGGTLTVNSWFVIGRNNVAANGTLIVNSGTVQKGGANNLVVGSLAATGSLIVNGGQVLNNGNLWLGENTGANATLFLNGGLVQATQVRANGTTPATSAAYFNGGTLQATASSTNFIQAPVIANIQSGGLVLDDGGFVLTNLDALVEDGASPGGGLIKTGTGTVYLDGANTYTGTTVVTNGTLAGIGSINSPVVVGPAGTIGAGDGESAYGTLTLNTQPLTINGGAFMRISKNAGTPVSDLITGISTANYGGTLVISNITTDATPLAAGDTFTLFNATTQSGNFTSIVGSPGSGLSYTFTNGVLSVVTGGIASNPTNITFSVSGNSLTLGWPEDHRGWILQSQTNTLSVGLTTNNWFDIAGTATVTNQVITLNATNPAVFFRLRHP